MAITMTLENTTEYDPENPIVASPGQKVIHTLLGFAVLSILSDRVVTLYFWQFESNPIVSALGIEWWIALTAVLLGFLWVAWYVFEAYQTKYGVICMLLIGILHSLAAVTNLMYALLF